ncbi:MSCRAMM family protein [Hominifimenecus sp. rT4P-3]|uniref:MSCRAMM family protein n=1 Tax=Hominifimenecus sp. rT4P-3 TaxID=3242979 RepID=UPI003DA27EB6
MRAWKKKAAWILAWVMLLAGSLNLKAADSFSDRCVLHTKRSPQFQQFEMDIYDSVHGPLYLMTLDDSLAFCMDYGKHSPSGTIYEKMEMREKISESQQEVIRHGLMFALYLENCIYGEMEWGNPDLENMTSESGQYLLMQIWVWAAMKGLSSLECADCVRRTYISWGQENKEWADNTYQLAEDFLGSGMDQAYSVEIAVYGSGSAANQDMFTYDFSTFQPAPDELAVGVYKVGETSGKAYKGAVYGVYADAACRDFVADLTTSDDGRGSVVFSGQEGTYYLKEITAPKGTNQNDTVYPVHLTYGSRNEVPYVKAENTEWFGQVSVRKVSEEGADLSGAAFDLEEWNGTAYQFHSHLKEKPGGIYESEQITYHPVNQGRYRITEKKAPYGHQNQGWNKELILTKNNQLFSYTVTNNPWQASVQVEKRDAESGNKISGAKFSLLEWDGSQYTPKGFLTDRGDGVYFAEKLAYTPSNQGKFKIQETKAPDGYVNDEWSQEFVITRQDQAFSYSLENTPMKGQIRIAKEDEESGKIPQGDATLEGAVYGLFARTDIIRPDHSGLLFRAGEQVGQAIIKNGAAEFTELPLGTYFIKELEAPEGYQLNAAEYDVVLSGEDQTKSLVFQEVTVKDAVKKRRVHLLKISNDGSAGEVNPLAGAEFTWKLKREVDADGWEQASTFAIVETDENGCGMSTELPYGVYQVRETKVPEGYGPVRDFLVEIREHDLSEPIQIILNDTAFQAYIQIIKVDQDTGEVIPLAGATFQLRNEAGETIRQKVGERWVDTFVTDETGTVTTPLMTVSGTYTVTEIQAPPGYRIGDEKVTFTVSGSEAELDAAGDPVIKVRVADPALEVEIRKVDMTAKAFVPGARLQVLREDGTIIDEWVSKEEPHQIHGIPAGTYILREIVAPIEQGYVCAKDLPFTVTESEGIQVVELMEDVTKVEIEKLDLGTGKRLPGAILQLRDSSGQILREWESGDVPEYFERLPVGEYILVEISAPEGYLLAEEVRFLVEDTGEVQRVSMEDLRLGTITGHYDGEAMRRGVKTGDSASLTRWLMLFGFAGVGLGVARWMKRRRNHGGQ